MVYKAYVLACAINNLENILWELGPCSQQGISDAYDARLHYPELDRAEIVRLMVTYPSIFEYLGKAQDVPYKPSTVDVWASSIWLKTYGYSKIQYANVLRDFTFRRSGGFAGRV